VSVTVLAEPATAIVKSDAPPPYAGLVTRAIAFAIDAAVINAAALLVAAVIALASTVLYIPSDAKTVILAVGGAAYVLWSAGYLIGFWATTGRTLGNRLMYIRVVPAKGGKLGYRRAFRRFVGLVIAVIPLMLGLAGILVNDRRRGFHDRLADTVVLYEPERRRARPGALLRSVP
jgi:uncharacterized RDD family membrane protein YckC